MSGQRLDIGITAAVVAAVYVTLFVAAFRHTAARTPSGIVRRLMRSGHPVTIRINALEQYAWDPSGRLRRDGFFAPGRATYTLADAGTVRVRFVPRVGATVERTGPITTQMLPDSPDVRHRRRIAAAVTAAYLAVGVAAFVITAALASGSPSLRARTGALVGLGGVSVAWLVTHFVLTRGRGRPAATVTAKPDRAVFVHARRFATWVLGMAVVSAAVGIAWHIDSFDQPQPTPWASAFLDAAIFVTLCTAAVAASTHHHNFVHHAGKDEHLETSP